MSDTRVRAKVWMLPTKDRKNYPLYIHDKGYLIERKYRVGEPNGNQKHLYFTTDLEIPKEIGAKCVIYNPEANKIVQNPSYMMSGEKLVVASTDKSLGLPEPSQSWIENYVGLGGLINEVDLEYESYTLGQCNCQAMMVKQLCYIWLLAVILQ